MIARRRKKRKEALKQMQENRKLRKNISTKKDKSIKLNKIKNVIRPLLRDRMPETI